MPELAPDYGCLACAWLVLDLCLACAWLETLWPLGKMAFFEPKMLHQVGIRFVKKC